MSSEFNFNKKRGMTVGKAWMLFLLLMIMYFVVGAIQGYQQLQKNSSNYNVDGNTLLILSIGGVFIISIIGYFINQKELPYFSGLSVKALLLALLVSFLVRFISSIFEELPLSFVEQENMKFMLESNYFLFVLPSALLIFLQIGVIGHGLLRNYDLTPAVATACLISLINFEPKAVLSTAFLVGVFMFFYYKIKSFEFVILGTFFYFYIDYFFLLFTDFEIVAENNYRYKIINNDAVYFTLLGIAILLLAFLIRSNAQLKSPAWRRKQEVIEY